MFALLLPLLLIPDKISNTHVCIFTVNMSCVFGMKDGYTKNDEYASIVIRATHLISGYLGSIIHVIHCPRHTSWESKVADNITWKRTSSFLEHKFLTDTVTWCSPRPYPSGWRIHQTTGTSSQPY
jgi:hypothetical protein